MDCPIPFISFVFTVELTVAVELTITAINLVSKFYYM